MYTLYRHHYIEIHLINIIQIFYILFNQIKTNLGSIYELNCTKSLTFNNMNNLNNNILDPNSKRYIRGKVTTQRANTLKFEGVFNG